MQSKNKFLLIFVILALVVGLVLMFSLVGKNKDFSK